MARLTCVQLAPQLADLAANTDMSTAAVAQAVDAGADVVVLPELVTSGYVFASVEEAASVAVAPDHPLFDGWARAAGGAVVVAGFAEAAPGEVLHNSAVVLDASGVRAVYRKVHLWDAEKRFFTPGDAAPPVVETAHGRIAVMVCFDLEFPEWTRTAALAGADLIAAPTNWPLGAQRPPLGERPGEVVIAMGAARSNHVAIACADRTGTERGVAWTQGTSIISADGWVLAAVGEGIGSVSADVDLLASREKVLTPLVHLFDDRRPELYGALTAPRPTRAPDGTPVR